MRPAVTGLAMALALVCASTARAAAPAPSRLSAETLKQFESLNAANKWVELETAAKAAMADLDSRPGADDLDRATALLWLERAHEGEGQYAVAETESRRLLAIREARLGPDATDTADAVDALAGVEYDLGALAEAERLYRRALLINQKRSGVESHEAAVELNNLALVVQDRGRFVDAETLYRQSLAIYVKVLGPGSPDTAALDNNLAEVLRRMGRDGEAEAHFRRALAVDEVSLGRDHPAIATILDDLAMTLEAQGRRGEAETLMRRAMGIDERALGPEHPGTGIDIRNLARFLGRSGRTDEAEPLMRRALAIGVKSLGPKHPTTAVWSTDMAALLRSQGRLAEAEPLLRGAIAVEAASLGPDHPYLADSYGELAEVRLALGDVTEARKLAEQAVRIDESRYGPAHPITLSARERLARILLAGRDFSGATKLLRPVCELRATTQVARELNIQNRRQSDSLSGDCSRRLSLALWGWSSERGGAGAKDRPAGLAPGGLADEAFLAAQRATQSAAAEALARAAALTAAQRVGVGAEAEAYEAALSRRDALDQALSDLAGEPGPAAADKRQTLQRDRAAVGETIERLRAVLIGKSPSYWAFRAPGAVSVAELRQGPASLLRPDEALILFETPSDADQGLVFAVTRESVAWAEVDLSGAALAAKVRTLRQQIDPMGYGGQDAASGVAQPGRRRLAFDRGAAFELYQTLFGDPAIQAAIGGKATWLIVPSGSLTTLPPGLLVTAPPLGGAAGDTSPGEMRATAWLARSHAIGILPAVASLRSARSRSPASAATATTPLLALADPDFGGGPDAGRALDPRGIQAYFQDGKPNENALRLLPDLPGARAEAAALQRVLGAGDDSVLSGVAASKSELFRRNQDGRLAQVRVLEFATHGLVTGDISGLAEPALALSAQDGPHNILLRASEAAGLTLHADWVILSACNTAGPDAPGAQGLSGLTRAFLFAGARSMVVSHWRLSDDVAETLIPAMIRYQRENRSASKAEALQKASLGVLDDGQPRHAFPFAWAPFVLIGDTD